MVGFADPAVARRHLRYLVAVPLLLLYLIQVGLPLPRVVAEGYQRALFASYDLVHQLRADLTRRGLLRRSPPDQVVVIAVDETSLERYGRWPWSRPLLARLLAGLRELGSPAIAVDVLLADADRGPVHQLRRHLRELPDPEAVGLAALQRSLEALPPPGPGATGAARWLADPEGGDGELARTLAARADTVLGCILYHQGAGDSLVDWSMPGPEAPLPEDLAGFLLDRSPGLTRARLEADWRKGLLPTRLFDATRMPAPTVTGSTARSRQALRVEGPEGARAVAAVWPRPLFMAAAGVGFLNDDTTTDGVVRSLPLVRTLWRRHLPSLTLAGLAALRGGHPELRLDDQGRLAEVRVPGALGAPLTIPCLQSSSMWLNVYPPAAGPGGPPASLLRISAAQVLDATAPGAPAAAREHLATRLRGRLAFLGATATGLIDIRYDPLGLKRPGVENHATLAANLLNGETLSSGTFEACLTFALDLILLLILATVLPRVRPSVSLLWLGGLSLASVATCVLAFQLGSILIPGELLLPMLLYYPLAVLYLNRFENRDKAWIDQMFKRYVSPEYVEELKRNKGELVLGGQEAEITAFFSDLRGFSSFSEHFSAERLFVFLGEYLGEMATVLDRYGGTLDKFEGDSVVAFFGAPIHSQDHALRACRAGLDMLARLAELNARWRDGAEYPELVAASGPGGWRPVQMRIGMNTARCAIGHLGTAERGNYTMMGDGVNLAARLEGAGKVYGVSFCVSESVAEAVQGAIELRELDRIRVVGKSIPTRIFEVLGRSGELDEATTQAMAAFRYALELFRSREFERCQERLRELAAERPEDVPTRLYLERCERFLRSPPPEDWDGVTDLEQK